MFILEEEEEIYFISIGHSNLSTTMHNIINNINKNDKQCMTKNISMYMYVKTSQVNCA